MKNSLYEFVGSDGAFRVNDASTLGPVYFPIANELGLLSAVTPELHGDIKLDQHSFLTPPVSYEDLHLSRAARNFWLSFHTASKTSLPWSVSGNSVWQKASADERTRVQAGFLWHEITRTSKKFGIEARTLSFVPPAHGTFEVMFVEIKNISRKKISFVATSAIPMFGRSADNIRDHRHVTSLLNRIMKDPFGLKLRPTMSFNERGHLINTTSYYVIGTDDKGRAPTGFFPTVPSFIGEGGSLDRPLSLLEGAPSAKKQTPLDNGKEAMGALQFSKVTLKPGQSVSYTLLLGIEKENDQAKPKLKEFTGRTQIEARLNETKRHWADKISKIHFNSGEPAFNRWIQWVEVQPILRKIYGCSFLPDFDYGRGGRGWRDLWQDCLALLLANPEDVRDDIVRNYGGVRIDGSNATIIGRKKADPLLRNGSTKWVPEFIADRNNIVRTWMDHGVWPFLTTLLYLNQTGDWSALLEKVPYFRDAFLFRGLKLDKSWAGRGAAELETRSGGSYRGTVLEHILVQTLVQFFNVGEHNLIRLEDADWNDGLDMAKERGESAAFTSMYAGNMEALATMLDAGASRGQWTNIEIAEEMAILLDRLRKPISYDDLTQKQKRLEQYFTSVSAGVSGCTVSLPAADIARDLRDKATWIRNQVNRQEWVEANGFGWFNGYYDNAGRRVEGKTNNGDVHMTLAGQVYPIMSGVADSERSGRVVKAVEKYLWDKQLGGVRLNTDFGADQPDLGRAFSFAYGEKENGAIFSHMAVMYAFALYKRGFVDEGFRVLNGLYAMAATSKRSQIFPGLPEYFNNEGRGRYAYLTGSASWYVLTLLTQVFGVRGEWGDLILAPKLVPQQFDAKGRASVDVFFAGARVTVNYHNPSHVEYDRMRIKTVKNEEGPVRFTRLSDKEILIVRNDITGRKSLTIDVEIERVK